MLLNFNKSVSAKMSGSTLVVAFQKSDPPLIWKFDLERNHSFTVAFQGEDNDLTLGINTARGEFQPIARFTDREAAEEAFAELQKILMMRRINLVRMLLSWLGGMAVFLFVLWLIIKFATAMHWLVQPSTGAPEITPGMPVPADKVLRPPPLPGESAIPPSQYP